MSPSGDMLSERACTQGVLTLIVIELPQAPGAQLYASAPDKRYLYKRHHYALYYIPQTVLALKGFLLCF